MAGRTDGATTSGSQSDPSAQWDSTLSEAIASTGIDPTAPFEDDSAAESTTPQVAESESSAGASPAGSPAAPQTSTTGDDGQGTAAPGAASSSPAASAAPIPDAQPFTYQGADGQSKTIEGAMVLPGDGLYIPESQIPHVQLLATNAEALQRQNRDLYDKAQQWERLTKWEQQAADGTKTVLTGQDAIVAQRATMAALATQLQLYQDALDPKNFHNLVELVLVDANFRAVPDGDPSGVRYVPIRNETGFSLLNERVGLRTQVATMQATSHASRMAAPPPPPEATIDEIALPTVEQTINTLKVTGLTDADKQYLAKQLQHYVRQATPQERQQYGQPRIVDERFVDVVKDRAALRAETVKAAQASTKTDTFNAGMQSGRKQPPKAAQRSPATPTAKPAPQGKAAQWDQVFQDAMADIAI